MGSDQYEFEYIYERTGKYPAIRGLDYMNDDFDGVNRRAAEWYDRGGIVTICWHCGSDFSGGWFWWGKGGAENFKKLWIIMYDRYTKYHKLDNLIWVLGYSGNGKGYDLWYPGDDYVDIIGADSYTDGANENLYELVKKIEKKEMPICFHECGRIPTVEQLHEKDAGWVWFMAWHTEYLTDTNDDADLKEIYNDDYVITLDELPAFTDGSGHEKAGRE